MNAGWKLDILFHLLDSLSRVAQRFARSKIERQRHHRELPLVIHRERRVDQFEVRNCAQRHLLPGVRLHVDIVERMRIALQLRINFEHDVILVLLRVDDGDLPLAERVV